MGHCRMYKKIEKSLGNKEPPYPVLKKPNKADFDKLWQKEQNLTKP